MMKIHVTGAKGFLGKFVVDRLQGVGTVKGSDIGDMDITDSENVLKILGADVPDVIVHLAAIQGRAASRSKPLECFKVNALGTLNLLEACRELGIRKFVLMSSMTVHGRSEVPVDEESPIRPIHPYGASKAAAEALVHSYSSSYGIRAVILRPNYIVAAVPSLNYTENLIFYFMQRAATSGVIELAGDGHFQREWTHASDIAEAIRLAVVSNLNGCETFILSSPANRFSLYELADKIVNKIGNGKLAMKPEMEGFSLISSNKKSVEKLHWQPKISMDQILEEIWNGYKSLQ